MTHAQKGALVIETGALPEQARTRRRTLAPTLVLNVNDDMRIMQDEIFGPVLPIVTYREQSGFCSPRFL